MSKRKVGIDYVSKVQQVKDRNVEYADGLYERLSGELAEPTLKVYKARKKKGGEEEKAGEKGGEEKHRDFTLAPDFTELKGLLSRLEEADQVWLLNKLCVEMYATEEIDDFKKHLPRKYHDKIPEPPSSDEEEESEYSGSETDDESVPYDDTESDEEDNDSD